MNRTFNGSSWTNINVRCTYYVISNQTWSTLKKMNYTFYNLTDSFWTKLFQIASKTNPNWMSELFIKVLKKTNRMTLKRTESLQIVHKLNLFNLWTVSHSSVWFNLMVWFSIYFQPKCNHTCLRRCYIIFARMWKLTSSILSSFIFHKWELKKI